MTAQDGDRLRAELEKRLRRSGEWTAPDPLPSSAVGWWMKGAAVSEGSLPGYTTDQVLRDLMDWWEEAKPGHRAYVLRATVEAETPIPGALPVWWPAYERWLADRFQEWADTYELTPDDRPRFIAFWARKAGASAQAAARIDDGDPLRIPAVEGEVHFGPGAPVIEIRVASPLVDAADVARHYEAMAAPLRPNGKPPAVDPESVRFYLAYDRLMRTVPRDKAARLQALPADLRGTRNPNSASAYYGKLRKAFLHAFQLDEENVYQVPDHICKEWIDHA
ncbi:MAG: hypothetical protein Q7W16_06275 [Coriobacteriia bacterium]|nr:hypothetical protein [Coriobacteriia bacterium]